MSEETLEVNRYEVQHNEKSAMNVEKFCDIQMPDAIPLGISPSAANRGSFQRRSDSWLHWEIDQSADFFLFYPINHIYVSRWIK